ncbi:MAG: winged helix-turn-helix transcriptional regulator [Anaerolineae bacterium]|nr:winged helix-turn-helix transcriptional regulator [Anaerolineae bacterium]
MTDNALAIYHPDESTAIQLSIDVDHRTIWATQRQIADALGLDVTTVNRHVTNFKEQRGDKAHQSIAKFAIVTADGKVREVEHYDMTVITFIGFRAQATERTIAFQDWVGDTLDKVIQTKQPTALTPLQQLKAMVAVLEDQEQRLAEHDTRLARLEAHVDAAQTGYQHYSVLAFFKVKGLPAPDQLTAQRIGQRASKLSQATGYAIGKTPDPRFGAVNTYHVSILEQAIKLLGGGEDR